MMRRNVFGAAGDPCHVCATRAVPGSASPIAAKGGVEDGNLVIEVGTCRARVARPAGVGGMPVLGHGLIREDIVRDGTARPEPHLDTSITEEHGVGTATVLVEGTTKAVVRGDIGEAATGVVGATRSAGGMEELTRGEGHVVGAGVASVTRVEGTLVLSVLVDALDNVDFTSVGPVRTIRPESTPNGTTCWHVCRVHDDEGSDTPRELIVDSDRGTVSVVRPAFCADLHKGEAIVSDTPKALVPSLVAAEVSDIACPEKLSMRSFCQKEGIGEYIPCVGSGKAQKSHLSKKESP